MSLKSSRLYVNCTECSMKLQNQKIDFDDSEKLHDQKNFHFIFPSYSIICSMVKETLETIKTVGKIISFSGISQSIFFLYLFLFSFLLTKSVFILLWKFHIEIESDFLNSISPQNWKILCILVWLCNFVQLKF